MNTINVGVAGVTGYTGSELLKILTKHPYVNIKCITAKNYVGQMYSDIYENFNCVNNYTCDEMDIDKMSHECDLIFMALPHGVATDIINEDILKRTRIIDFSGDFRLKDSDVYEKWYNVKHNCKDILKKAVYGLSELNRIDIKNANIVANAGCYTTCSILSLMPLVAEDVIYCDSIIIDSKSGVSGAGRLNSINNMYCEVNESIKAYNVASHRHTPEIEQELSRYSKSNINLLFTPHLVPMNRGILSTCYANLKYDLNYCDIKDIYEKYYNDEHFIRITKEGVFPQTKWVKGSNFVDIGFKIDGRTNKIIVVGAIDNIVKGASGQAVQNMNIMFGIDENTGIDIVGSFPI